MFKLILNLITTRASKQRWQLELGAYLLKQGAGVQLDEILYEKRRTHFKNERVKVKVVSEIFYNFRTNEIVPTTVNKTVDASAIKKAS